MTDLSSQPAPEASAEPPAQSFDPSPEPAAEAQPLDLSGLEADVASVFGFGDESPPAQPAPVAPEAAPGPELAPEPGAVTPPSPTPATPQPATPAAPAALPPLPGQPPAPVAPPADDPVLRAASLEAQVAALSAQLQELRANPPAAPAPAAPGPDQVDPLDQPVGYNLSLPEQVQQALVSEDPAHTVQAVAWVANAVATIVHSNLRKEFGPQFQRLVNGMVSEASQAISEKEQVTSVETARKQYYEKFPDHNNPLIKHIVAAEAQTLAAQYPGLSWNDDYINSLGTRVNAAIASLRGQGAEPPAPTPPPARPAAMLPANGPRPAVNTGAAAEQDIVFETMQDGDFWGG